MRTTRRRSINTLYLNKANMTKLVVSTTLKWIVMIRVSYVSRKHLISFMAAKHPKKERRIMAVEEMRMM